MGICHHVIVPSALHSISVKARTNTLDLRISTPVSIFTQKCLGAFRFFFKNSVDAAELLGMNGNK